MFTLFKIVPLLVPVLGGMLLYIYRARLKGVLAPAVCAIILLVVSVGINSLGDKLIFAAETYHHTEALRSVVGGAALGGAWVLLFWSAFRRRPRKSAAAGQQGFGKWLIAAALLLFIALVFNGVMTPMVPQIADSESGRMVVGMLVETVYFGLSSIATLLLFFAVTAGRPKNGDTHIEPEEYAKKVARNIWRMVVAAQKTDRR